MRIHIVQKGDTLWELSQKYNVDFDELVQLNSQIASPDLIMPGMKIKIPDAIKEVKSIKKEQKVKKEQQIPKKMKDIVQKEQPILPNLPELPIEEPMTLPILDMEKGAYPTDSFPEFKEEKEKPKTPVQPEVAPQTTEQTTQNQHMQQPQQAQFMPQMTPHCTSCMQQLPANMGCQSCGQSMMPVYQPCGMPVAMPYPLYYPMPYQQQHMQQGQMMQPHPNYNMQMPQQMIPGHMVEANGPMQFSSPAQANQSYEPTTFPAHHFRQDENISPEAPHSDLKQKDKDTE